MPHGAKMNDDYYTSGYGICLSYEAYGIIQDVRVRKGLELNLFSPEDEVLIRAAMAESIRLNEERNNCKNCKESFARSQCVCFRHYHDYVDCGSNICFICLVHARGPLGEE